jgi:hypothetical protein
MDWPLIRRYSGYYLLGVFLTLLAEGFRFAPIQTTHWSILPGHFAMLLLPVLLSLRAAGCAGGLRPLALVCGVLATDSVHVVILSNQAALPSGVPLWFGRSLTPALVGLAVSVGTIWLTSSRAAWRTRGVSFVYVVLFVASLAATIASFRLIHHGMLQRGVPNEARSLWIGGQEIHHAVTASVAGFLLGSVLLARPSTGVRLFAALALGVIAGAVADESLYLCLASVTDDAYTEATSLTGACLFGLLYALVMTIAWKVRGRPEEAGTCL